MNSGTPSLAAISLLMAISALGGMAKGLTGFGGALVMAPLFSLVLPPAETATLVVLVHCASSLQGLRSWGIQARWPMIVPLAAVSIVTASLLTHFLTLQHAVTIRHLIGISVLLATALHWRGWVWRHDGGWLSTLLAGLLAGGMTACGGLGGPAALYYLNGTCQGPTLRANLLAYFALLFGGVTLTLAFSHRITVALLAPACSLTAAFVVGGALGQHLHGRLPRSAFDRIVCGLLAASGLTALLS